MIRIESLTKSFGNRPVLRGVSLSVARGEVAAIIGHSGCGKSTLLRCINGLESFQTGAIQVGDITLTADLVPRERALRLGQIRRRIGMVFQQFNLFPHRTALGNVIEAPIHVLGRPRAEAQRAGEALLQRVGLGEFLQQNPANLSGGQQQRVAIARALAMQPEAILFDEPTSALDPRMAAEVEDVIVELATAGQTMVVVTHALELARRIATTVHVLDAGRVAASGQPDDVLNRWSHSP